MPIGSRWAVMLAIEVSYRLLSMSMSVWTMVVQDVGERASERPTPKQ